MAVEKIEATIVGSLDKKSLGNAIKETQNQVKRLNSTTGIFLKTRVINLENKLKSIKSQIKRVEKRGDFTARAKLQLDSKGLQQQLSKARSDLTNFTKRGSADIGFFKKSWNSLRDTIGKGLLITGAIASIFGLGKAVILLGDKLEQSEIAFSTMLGSAEKAQILLNNLTQYAKVTPFEINGLRQTSKQLLAFGFDMEEIIPTINALGNVASGLSVPLEQIAYAYGQVKSANQLYGTELRQFVNAGVPLLKELADMYGVTESEAKKMVEDGKVGFKDVEQAFKNMTEEGGKFYDLNIKQSKTLTGKWSNLKDKLTAIGEKIGTFFIPMAKKVVDALSWLVDRSVDAFKGLQILYYSVIHGLVLTIIGLKLAWKSTTISIISYWNHFAQGLFQIGKNISIIIDNIQEFFSVFGRNLYKIFFHVGQNASILVDNIGTSFDNLPGLVKKGVNGAVRLIEQFLNWGGNKLSGFLSSFGVDIKIPPITLPKFDVSTAKSSYRAYIKTLGGLEKGKYRELKAYNSKFADDKNKILDNELKDYQKNMLVIKKIAQNSYENKIFQLTDEGNENKKLNTTLEGNANDDKNRTKDKIKGSKAKQKEKKKEIDQVKEKAKLEKEIYKRNKKFIQDELKSNKESLKINEKKLKLLKDGIKDFEDINKKIKENTDETAKDIADRYKELKDDLKDTKKDIIDFGDKHQQRRFKRLAEMFTRNDKMKKSLENMGKDDNFGGGISVGDLREWIELKEKQKNIEEEMKLARTNTTLGDIKKAKQSETEKLLAEKKAKEYDLLLEKETLEKKLGIKEENLTKEIELEERKKLILTSIKKEYSDLLKSTEEQITKTQEIETGKRINLISKEEKRIKKLIALRAKAGLGNEITNNTNRIVNNTSNTNTNTNTINVQVTKEADIKDIAPKIIEQVNLANKGIR